MSQRETISPPSSEGKMKRVLSGGGSPASAAAASASASWRLAATLVSFVVSQHRAQLPQPPAAALLLLSRCDMRG